LAGGLAQTAAATGHNVTAAKLAEISRNIPKILILTGDVDDLIKPVNSEYMAQNMPEAEYQVWQGYGHGLIGQNPKRFNETLERVIREGRERASKAPWV
jgi:pimeloyl-ACP methyl ester carboxylesterase